MPFPEDVDVNSPIDRLKVAFAMFVAKLIVDSDGIVDFGELRLMGQVFPDKLLEDMGFLDANGSFTQAYKDAYVEATRVLPERLGRGAKLELVTMFHRAAWADGELLQAELLVLREASEVLGVPLAVLSEHLDGLRSIARR